MAKKVTEIKEISAEHEQWKFFIMTPTFSFSREKVKNETVLKSGTIRFFVSVA